MSLAPPPPLLFAGPNAIVKLGCLLLALPPVACTRTALELTSENWDREVVATGKVLEVSHALSLTAIQRACVLLRSRPPS